MFADLDCPGGQASASDPEPAQPEGGLSWLLTVVPASHPVSQPTQPSPAQPEGGIFWLLPVGLGHWGREGEVLQNRLEHKVDLSIRNNPQERCWYFEPF